MGSAPLSGGVKAPLSPSPVSLRSDAGREGTASRRPVPPPAASIAPAPPCCASGEGVPKPRGVFGVRMVGGALSPAVPVSRVSPGCRAGRLARGGSALSPTAPSPDPLRGAAGSVPALSLLLFPSSPWALPLGLLRGVTLSVPMHPYPQLKLEELTGFFFAPSED